MKKYLNLKTLIVLLLIGLFVNNYFLQQKLEVAINAANNAEGYARRAYSEAQDASLNAADASDYAQEAAENAENANYSAQAASRNSFGNQCWTCP